MCGVTIASWAAAATEMPVFHAWGTMSRPALGGEVADAASLGEPPDPADVGLRDLHAADVDQHLEVVAGREPLARRDPHRRARRQLRVPGDVVRPERRLEEEHVEVGPRLGHPQRALDGVERVLDVDHDRHLRADGARGQPCTTSVIRSSGPTRPLWTYGPENVASSLHARKPMSLRARRPADHRLDVGLEGLHLGLQRRVRRRAPCARSRPRAASRERLAPCRRCPRARCRALRAHARPRPAARTWPCRRRGPARRLGVERIASDQHLLEATIHRVCPGRLDAGPRDPGVEVGLADPR